MLAESRLVVAGSNVNIPVILSVPDGQVGAQLAQVADTSTSSYVIDDASAGFAGPSKAPATIAIKVKSPTPAA
jgi:hypothetical protein